jgi:hypothetical protein
LDETIYGKMPAESFGTTQEEMDALIGPVYRTLKAYYFSYHYRLVEASGDMAVIPTRRGGDYWNNGIYKEVRMHKWTPDNTLITRSYSEIMSSISTCNQIYKTVEMSGISNKERVLAEIRGVRAFLYYVYCDNYGNGPLVTDFSDTSLPSTTKREDIYKFVIDELTDIKDILDSAVNSATYGAFTKGVAYTLLAKMYLNAEIWNPSGGSKWQECMDACDVVLALDYSLETNWKANFNVDNQKSKEIIFPIVFSAADGGHTLAAFTLHYLDGIYLGLNLTPNNGFAANPDYVKAYDEDDKRSAWSFLIGASTDPATGDTIITAHNRPLIHTIDIPIIEDTKDADGWGQVEQEVGARCFKFEFAKGLTGNMENDFPIFRLADIYLMKAECLVRLGKDNDEATRLVNAIRERAFNDNSKLKKSVILTDIYNERRFELAWEGYSRQDQIRYGTFLLPSFWKPYVSDEKYLVFPIAKSAMDANPNLIQNKGY